ncbi:MULTISPECIES: DUF1775 domain-containing protein [Lentzea]|uniref:LPXTG-motif cell wall anchor domain-containing protein n=1 Tax=Lentzea albida TaxID=65499 RepID=A0A1H9RIJ7_9PSEU|nr:MULTISPECIES: DUF1775 domain-containing protein [Lentzea]USX54408.1 DUF1775 domain-containing protein [Lentzea sp. HUAS12]SER72660.1 LPXTG-motif cell wall anchor domain-containing protein [Lentzea albida]
MLIKSLACLTVLFALGTATASAHVTAHAPDGPPEKGGHGTVVLRVPNEEMSSTTRFEVTLSPAFGITTARTRPVPGWDAAVRRGDGGVVTSVVWTARSDSGIPGGNEHYEDFGLTLGPLPADADHVLVPATQFLSDGSSVRWDDQPGRPAPVVALAEPSGHGHHATLATGADVPWAAVVGLLAVGLLLAVSGFVLLRRKGIS